MRPAGRPARCRRHSEVVSYAANQNIARDATRPSTSRQRRIEEAWASVASPRLRCLSGPVRVPSRTTVILKEDADISRVQPGQPIPLTSSARVICTHHISDTEVQPGQLDIVMIPGPDPLSNFDDIKDATDWLAAHAARPETDILSICTGIYLCGAAGLLKGKKACGPRGLQGHLAKKFEGVQWVGEGLRWVRDGNLWSSGESMTAGIVWQILKAVFMGFGKMKAE